MRKHSLKLASFAQHRLAVGLFAPQRATADEDDPPSRVARLSSLREPFRSNRGHRRFGFPRSSTVRSLPG